MAKRLLTSAALILVAMLMSAIPAVAAPAWQQPELVAADGLIPAVAVDDAGNSYAAWSTMTELRFAWRPAGGGWQPSELVSSAPAVDSQVAAGPQMGVDAAGNVTIAWREGGQIKATTRGPRAATIQPVQTVATDDYGGAGYSLHVARNGSAVIAYANDARRVVIATRAAGATAFGAVEDPEVTTAYPIVDSPNAWIGDDGTVGVAYSPNGIGVIAAVRPAGGSWDVETADGGFFRAANAAIAVDPTGGAVLAYFDGSDELIVRGRPPGAARNFGPADDVSLPGSGGGDFLAPVQMKLDALGNATIAWRQNGQVYVVDRPSSGPLGMPVSIPGSAAGDYVRLAIDSAGAALVSWRGSDTPSPYPSDTPGPVYAAVRPAGGSFGSAVTLAKSAAYAPTIAAGPAGSGVVAWGHRVDAGCTQIEASLLADGAQADLASPARACADPTAAATTGAGAADSAADRTPPHISLGGGRQAIVKKGVISLTIACDEYCSGIVTATVQHRLAKNHRAKKMRAISLPSTKFRVKAERRTTVRFKLTRGQVIAIKKMLTRKGEATFVATVVATDANGNRSRAKRKIPLAR